MAVVPLLNSLRGAFLQHKTLIPRRNSCNSRIPCLIPKKSTIFRPGRDGPRFNSSNSTERSGETRFERELEGEKVGLFQAWNVPWDWKVTAFVMMPYLMSIFLTGIIETDGLKGLPQPYPENALPLPNNTDELATRLLVDQSLKTVVKLSVLSILVSPYRPFPDDIFSFRWERPLNLQNGWMLWACGGLIIASASAFLVKAFVSGSNVSQTQDDAEFLVRLLPFIGSSNISTFCLLGILGILTPVCEETLYRGFLMTSLTKWFPVHLSVIVSSVIFSLAHRSPGNSLEIFIFGTILGIVYARTRNLLAPITMHAFWNLGVILLLTFLRSQGYEINELVR